MGRHSSSHFYFMNKNTVCGVGTKDVPMCVNGNIKKSYNIWKSMLQRCYSSKTQKLHPSYIGCTVCPDWKYFSNFEIWCDENYIVDFELDKDLLVRNNRLYSPETCCFIPSVLNSIFQTKHNGKYKLGVEYYPQNNKFCARMSSDTITNSKRYIGLYCTEDEAYAAYCDEKCKRIKIIAEYYKHKLTPEVYDCLLRWTP